MRYRKYKINEGYVNAYFVYRVGYRRVFYVDRRGDNNILDWYINTGITSLNVFGLNRKSCLKRNWKYAFSYVKQRELIPSCDDWYGNPDEI